MARLSLNNAILEAMHGEGWMLARDISLKLRLGGWKASPIRVARIISARLTPWVETRKVGTGQLWLMYRLRGG